jgi:hypothetical protein
MVAHDEYIIKEDGARISVGFGYHCQTFVVILGSVINIGLVHHDKKLAPVCCGVAYVPAAPGRPVVITEWCFGPLRMRK